MPKTKKEEITEHTWTYLHTRHMPDPALRPPHRSGILILVAHRVTLPHLFTISDAWYNRETICYEELEADLQDSNQLVWPNGKN